MKKLFLLLLLSKAALAGDGTISNPDLADNASVALSKLQLIGNNSIVGNKSGNVSNPSALNSAQVTSILDAFTGDSGAGGVKGAVLAPGAGDGAAGKFLSARGTWSVPPIPIPAGFGTGSVIVAQDGNWISSVVAVPPCVALGSGTNIDWSLGNCFTKTLSGSVAMTFSRRSPGQTIVFKVKNPSVYTITFPTGSTPGNSVLWASSTIPTMSTAGKKDIFTIFFDGEDMFGSATQAFGGP